MHHDTSSTDINMPSSPPRPDMTLYSSTQSNFSTSLSGLPSSTQTYKTRVEDIKPSSEVLSAVLSTQDSVATQGSSASKSIKKERSHSQPMLRLPPRHTELAPLAELRHLPPPLAYMKFVNDFTDRNMACSFLLPCMLADSGSPFVYDGIPRSEDYLGMAFAGLRWEA